MGQMPAKHDLLPRDGTKESGVDSRGHTWHQLAGSIPPIGRFQLLLKNHNLAWHPASQQAQASIHLGAWPDVFISSVDGVRSGLE